MEKKEQNKKIELTPKQKQARKLTLGIRNAERVGNPALADDLRQRLKLLGPV